MTCQCMTGRDGHAAMVEPTGQPLYHTMSALVAQRPPAQSREAAAAALPLRAVAGQSPASCQTVPGQLESPRLTAAVLAAADDVTSSAEKLPVSHRLPVSRSVFDSDEGDDLLIV